MTGKRSPILRKPGRLEAKRSGAKGGSVTLPGMAS